jgi:HD superfamily phosphohydrolase
VAVRVNKKKIINDPVYGFINIPNDFIYDIIEHPWFQRLRNIKQLGLTNLVYPGANHNRFQHALGALHLMSMALATLKSKGVQISDDEEEAACLAILLHDIGHGPFSHALENTIIEGINHEDLSLFLINKLNELYSGRLTLATEILFGKYQRMFLHELVSSQMDMDRLDYLSRDSFFTGVIEGLVSSERIIRMLNVADDSLVIDENGIYSLEKFLFARRLMYWQVYMHKTVISAESLLAKLLVRARELVTGGTEIFTTPALGFFLSNRFEKADFLSDRRLTTDAIAEHFVNLDDSDIMIAAKYWVNHPDIALSNLAGRLIRRNLFAIELANEPFSDERVEKLRKLVEKKMRVGETESKYFVYSGDVSNLQYSPEFYEIKILLKNGKTDNISSVSDIFNNKFISEKIIKYFLCYPKEYRK